MTARDHEREETFARLYQSGKTLQQIADQHAVTRQYVHAVLKRAGIVMGRPPVADPVFVLAIVRSPFTYSITQVAAVIGCDRSSIRLSLIRLSKYAAVTRLFKWRKRALRNSK